MRPPQGHQPQPEERTRNHDTRIDPPRHARGDRRGHQGRHRRHGGQYACIGGGIAHRRLQPLRDDDDAREIGAKAQRQRENARCEADVAEYPQIDDRMLLGQFPDDEGGKADHGQDRQDDDQRIAEPVMVAADIQHDLQATDPENEQKQAHAIDRHARRVGFHRAQQRHRRHHAQDRDRHVDEEDPVPAPIVADIAADDRPHCRAEQRGHRP